MRDECKLMISKTLEFLFHWVFFKCMVSIHGLEFRHWSAGGKTK